ncbi:hypothetical protein [Bacillus thuringiensis]|uniref:hypothetical protein n=1 Tax=Bacillus thuringiensis TaxID=1428 RepID=UPI001F486AC4|nr:hypothetical protein [Bacillus thuringiensis]
MKKKILATTAVFSLGLTALGHTTITFATEVHEQEKGQQFEIVQKSREISRLGQSSGGQLIFSQVGDQLEVVTENPDQKISTFNKTEWKVLVDGVERYTFSEAATAKEVKVTIDTLNLKEQKFEIVQGLTKIFTRDWETQTPLNLTYTSSATANDIYLDENKNVVIYLSFNLDGYIDDYLTYEKPDQYIEIELPRGVTFAGEKIY